MAAQLERSSTRSSTRSATRSSHRSTLSMQKTEVKINVYDLLPPGRISSALWVMGSSLLHSGVVINDKEYAYGGHGCAGLSGVYWTKPGQVPPGALFQCEIVHGFTFASGPEIDATIRDVSAEFLGPSYSLLELNCNHFTSHLVERLTGRPGPAWLNRAARIGVALPCVVPREWVQPPAADNADAELVEEEDEVEQGDESSHMLPGKPQLNSISR